MLLGAFLCIGEIKAGETADQQMTGTENVAEENADSHMTVDVNRDYKNRESEKCRKLWDDCDRCRKAPETKERVKQGMMGTCNMCTWPAYIPEYKECLK